MDRMVAVIPNVPDHLEKCRRISDVGSITRLEMRFASGHDDRNLSCNRMHWDKLVTYGVMVIGDNREIKKVQVGLELSFVVALHLHLGLRQVLATGGLLGDASSNELHLLNFCLFCSQIMQLPELRKPYTWYQSNPNQAVRA